MSNPTCTIGDVVWSSNRREYGIVVRVRTISHRETRVAINSTDTSDWEPDTEWDRVLSADQLSELYVLSSRRTK